MVDGSKPERSMMTASHSRDSLVVGSLLGAAHQESQRPALLFLDARRNLGSIAEDLPQRCVAGERNRRRYGIRAGQTDECFDSRVRCHRRRCFLLRPVRPSSCQRWASQCAASSCLGAGLCDFDSRTLTLGELRTHGDRWCRMIRYSGSAEKGDGCFCSAVDSATSPFKARCQLPTP